MTKVIVYGSEYGTTKQYAEKLSQLTGIPTMSYETVKEQIACKQVIYFGGLYAGGVKGLKRTVKLLSPDTRLVLVTVGLADVTDKQNIDNIQRSIRNQVPESILKNAELFHLRGGIDYSKLSFTHKTMMALLYNKAKHIPDEKKTADVRALIETYNTKVDFSDFGSLEQIIKAIQ